MDIYKLYKLEEIIDRHLVADKATHMQAQAIMAELIKEEIKKQNGDTT